jgi:biopolymer transport protein ExbD
MRRALYVLIALVTFSIGAGFVSVLQFFEDTFPDLAVSGSQIQPIQLDRSTGIALLESAEGCGTLIVRLEQDGQLTLNSVFVGTVDDTEALSANLEEIFRSRIAAHRFAPGLEHSTDLTTEERIMKTVFIKAPRSAKYSDVIKVLDAVRDAGADPIGLVSEKGSFSGTSR